ncbi:hypothetical protein LTR53_013861, partial [Teratosphaeriaceae sp. CCFEE 6253]
HTIRSISSSQTARMAKEKTKAGVPNRHLHARISYLQQAATYLTVQGRIDGGVQRSPDTDPATAAIRIGDCRTEAPPTGDDGRAGTSSVASLDAEYAQDTKDSVLALPHSGGVPLRLTSHLQQIARKAQIRLHPHIKHSICRTCSTVLVDGETCRKRMENLSRGGAKLHADVLVIQCAVCGAVKRFPVGATRQERKARRDLADRLEAECRATRAASPAVVLGATKSMKQKGPEA